MIALTVRIRPDVMAGHGLTGRMAWQIGTTNPNSGEWVSLRSGATPHMAVMLRNIVQAGLDIRITLARR